MPQKELGIIVYFPAKMAAMHKSQWNVGSINTILNDVFAIRAHVLCPPAEPGVIGFRNMVKMVVVNQLPSTGVNQMVQFPHHFLLIEKIIRTENHGADIHL
jgi:hypothetical protein